MVTSSSNTTTKPAATVPSSSASHSSSSSSAAYSLPAPTSIATYLLQDFTPLVQSVGDIGPAICKLTDDIETIAAKIVGNTGAWKKKVAMDVITMALEGPLHEISSIADAAEHILAISGNLIDSIVGLVNSGFSVKKLELDVTDAESSVSKICCFHSKKSKSTKKK